MPKIRINKDKFLLVMIDVVIINAAIIGSLLLRFEGIPPAEYFVRYAAWAPLVTAIFIAVFYLFGLYHRMWSYASVDALFSILFATATAPTLILIIQLFVGWLRFPYSIFILSFILNFLFIGGSRFTWRILREFLIKGKTTTNVIEGEKTKEKRALIYGAGEAGATIVNEMLRRSDISYLPVGFLDDNLNKHGMHIRGIKVLGSKNDLQKLVKREKIEEVIIAIPSIHGKAIREIISLCKEVGVAFKTLPGMSELIDGKITINYLREVKIEDILGRESVSFDSNRIAQAFGRERILVTGAGGSIGSELTMKLAPCYPKELILFGKGENSIFNINEVLRDKFRDLSVRTVIGDVRDEERVDRVIKRFRPTVIFHAAAHKHVNLMEQNPVEAISNNVIGTRNVAMASIKYGVSKFILISTDKAVYPKSFMGMSKRLAELLMLGMNKAYFTQFITVRFGNVLGSRGSVVRIFEKQIAKGGPVTVTHSEAQRFFMTISEAAELIIQAGLMGKGGEVFVLDMGEPVKIVNLARDCIALSGLEEGSDIKIEIIGLRPGEKLAEDLFYESEKLSPTNHKKILGAKPNSIDYKNLDDDIVELSRMCHSLEKESLFEKISNLVSKYNYP